MTANDAAGQHGHDKDITIIVNGRERTVPGKEVTFEQIVKLAFGDTPPGENTIYTITYAKAEGSKHEGTLVAGQSVKVKKGTVFNVTPTDKS